ncbi:GFA domain-containing protein [Mycena venus]|uniref:GFA domain-containing protein n=1 Tax=Mycena venus TaxID=2733690 RepID=A0A8H6YK61_9AGAR|nr:GFA domain-containing protein [Mycena venus]
MGVMAQQKDVHIEGPVKTYVFTADSGNAVTHIFCSNCGSPISQKSPAFGEHQAVRTVSFGADFGGVPISAELFVKSRWIGVPAVKDAAQFNTATQTQT